MELIRKAGNVTSSLRPRVKSHDAHLSQTCRWHMWLPPSAQQMKRVLKQHREKGTSRTEMVMILADAVDLTEKQGLSFASSADLSLAVFFRKGALRANEPTNPWLEKKKPVVICVESDLNDRFKAHKIATGHRGQAVRQPSRQLMRGKTVVTAHKSPLFPHTKFRR